MNAETYLKHWEQNQIWTHYAWPKHQKRFQTIASMCAGKTCIDVGCGFGHSTKRLSNFYEADWTGLEFSSEAIKKAKENFPKLNFIYAENYRLDEICNKKYDSVICSEVIEHIEDDRAFISELMKIVEKKLILTTPSQHVDDPGHLRIYNANMIENLLDGFCYTVKSIGGYYYVEVRR
jgi:2-polyprenyl-3-methyl-5-hydroxy-6-metoxy-1,4-benzoquinol methylase